MRDGLALVADSGSYLAGAAGFTEGRWFRTPLVPTFSEQPLLETVAAGGWSPYADFGIGLPLVISAFATLLPLTTAAATVNALSIAAIAVAVVVGPAPPRTTGGLWVRTAGAVALAGLPILRFTGAGVLSEPLFCALALWLAVLVARFRPPGTGVLVGTGALAILLGLTRFVGPAAALAAGLLLVQRGLSWWKAAAWTSAASLVPVVATLLSLGPGGSRPLGFHPRGAEDVFFLARGVGGWFEAGLGDQTATLFPPDVVPSFLEWAISVGFVAACAAVVWWWLRPPFRRDRSGVEPALVLAVVLAAVLVPSMLFLDAILKPENRIMLPSGVLVLSALCWWLAERLAPAPALAVVAAWAVVATHPWDWLDGRGSPPPATVAAVVRGLDPAHVVTNAADLVWWQTDVPAAYLPIGRLLRSDRAFDVTPVYDDLPCGLAQSGGTVVVDLGAWGPEGSLDRLEEDAATGRYERTEHAPGVVEYRPTGLGC